MHEIYIWISDNGGSTRDWNGEGLSHSHKAFCFFSLFSFSGFIFIFYRSWSVCELRSSDCWRPFFSHFEMVRHEIRVDIFSLAIVHRFAVDYSFCLANSSLNYSVELKISLDVKVQHFILFLVSRLHAKISYLIWHESRVCIPTSCITSPSEDSVVYQDVHW